MQSTLRKNIRRREQKGESKKTPVRQRDDVLFQKTRIEIGDCDGDDDDDKRRLSSIFDVFDRVWSLDPQRNDSGF